MTNKNRKWLLAKRPTGIVGPQDFDLTVEPVPSIAEGEFLVRNRWLSCDPAQRTYMEFDSYIPAVEIGEMMVGASAGEVVESRHPDFQVGDVVTGAFGWQDYAVSDGSPSAASSRRWRSPPASTLRPRCRCSGSPGSPPTSA
ncbi:putative NADP-dependent oxidoreductase [Gordonia rhizosphera]|uniref:Putative NADP-dependent oxidoreductase n=1 Tax=Gordonia rhizosphera NBRC 16068 TaxID=1108045 RepID=K6VWA9_9ACTN|nr:putative NADP-dependent oxidoreductase [Gordonia rhizosphera]GAB91195.1 putative NADP-dependent oxidoreductase [Gordonia rhizosphera NBRC 16068]